MTQNISTLPYRRAVGIMLLNKHKQVFMGKRINNRTKEDAWQMPQGGVEENESIHEACMRELREETSITNATVIAETKDWLYYDLPKTLITQLQQQYKGQPHKGQQQKWLLLLFNGHNSDINLNTAMPEFKEWKWMPINEVLPLAVSYKKELYTKVIDAFRPNIESLLTV